jgi:hypothetical protein
MTATPNFPKHALRSLPRFATLQNANAALPSRLGRPLPNNPAFAPCGPVALVLD